MGLLKFVFILLVVGYGVKLLVRYLIPKALLHFLKKQGFHVDPEPDEKREGEIKIKVNRTTESKKDKGDFGEYVDFEEIEPDQNKNNEK